MPPISLKGPGPWRGKTTLNVADTGQSRFIKLENCYVNKDGSEIRHAFGLRSLLVLGDENPNGYSRYTIDALKPIFATTPAAPYQYRYQFDTAVTLTLMSKAHPTHIHCFEQIADELLIVGESELRQSPIYDSGGNKLTVVSVTTSAGAFQITLSGSAALRTAADSAGMPGLNGLRSDNIVYFENVTVSDPTAQAILDARLNRRCHAINAAGSPIPGATIVLTTTSGGLVGPLVATGEIHVTRGNRANTGYSPDGLSPYQSDSTLRIDDQDALTVWRVLDRLDPNNVGRECFPAWVANRQRDFGDERSAGIGEGRLFTSSPLCSRGQSRRFQRELPYRVQPEPANDRLILAAAGYGCLFDVPVKVTDDPLNIIARGLGANIVKRNDEHYKPRALGIPKAEIQECLNKTPPASEAQDSTLGFDFMVAVRNTSSQSLGLTPGKWQVGITYEDDALGIEGVGSEIVEVTIPTDATRAFTIRIPFLHPGYLMGETLANKVSVYLAPPNSENLLYYASFHLSRLPKSFGDVNATNKDLSAVYGFHTDIGTSPLLLYVRTIVLPMPSTGEKVEAVLDATRPFPIGRNAMPRGGQAARFVRGVLLAGGHVGNAGVSRELWESKASHEYSSTPNGYPAKDEIRIRERGATLLFPEAPDTDGTLDNSTLGIAGRCFPSAYQGIDFIHRALLPSGREYHTIDQVVNRKSTLLTNYGLVERIRLTRDVAGRTTDFGHTPSVSATNKKEQPIWYLLPRDQVEIGDPGLPTSSSKTNIKFLDPKRGDTLTAIGEVSGIGILCSRKETASFAWSRNPGAEEPHTLSNEFGCIASNSMVEFDGGCAWISDRGPVAYGAAGLQFIGDAVSEDFTGRERRYEFDEYGMMRCCWGAHDRARGLVMWGLVSRPHASLSVTSRFQPVTWEGADDKLKSRFPCNEVLLWSYTTNVFSTWRPPSGLEILWVRPMRITDGTIAMVACCADKNFYLMIDEAQEINSTPLEFVLSSRGVNAGSISWTGAPFTGTDIAQRNTGAGFLRSGMLVQVLNTNKEMVAETTLSPIAVGASTTITLATPVSWEPGYTLRIGARRNMVIVSTFRGGEKALDIDVRGIRMRYALAGGELSGGTANAKASAIKTTRTENGPEAVPKGLSDRSRWKMLGTSTSSNNQSRDETLDLAHTAMLNEGSAQAPEVAIKIEIAGSAQVRVADIILEVQ